MPLELFWTCYWAFVSFVFGAIVGSFLNVCIWRLPRNESLSDPPSHCPSCKHRLKFWPDMIPLLSQLWYRSRCRYCGTPFSWRYFWVELVTAVTFTAVYFRYAVYGGVYYSDESQMLANMTGMAFVAALWVVFFIDLELYQIPDLAIVVAAAAAVVKDLFLIKWGLRELWQVIPGTTLSVPIPLSILCGLVAFWMLWQFAALATALLGKEAMGAGDPLLLGAMGAFLIPWPLLLVAFMASVILGTVGGVGGMLLAARTNPSPSSPTSPPPPESSSSSTAPVPELDAALPSSSPSEAPGAPDPADSPRPSDPSDPSDPADPSDPSDHSEPADAEPLPANPAEEEEEDEPTPSDHSEIPTLPPDSRWGRLLVVGGIWLAILAVWIGLALFGTTVPALAMGLVGLAVGAVMVVRGRAIWIRGDEQWLPAMDALFDEGEPGPRFIPFGPYLVLGTLIAMTVGRPIVEWYGLKILGLDPNVISGLRWD